MKFNELATYLDQLEARFRAKHGSFPLPYGGREGSPDEPAAIGRCARLQRSRPFRATCATARTLLFGFVFIGDP